MIRIDYSSRYLSSRKKFLNNNLDLFNKTIKAISLFVKNPTHPSLNLEKLKGSHIWTIRIDKGNRIFFSWVDKSTVLFLDIGKHDKYRKY
jgi:mRNA-degrading endonuclease RelE of RelBE toxin-antitoxin system